MLELEFTLLFKVLIFLNILTFLMFGLDKWKAKRRKWRIPEKQLLFFTAFGGLIGAVLGMLVFRHKIKDKTFLPYFGGIVVLWFGLIFYLLIRT